ncbi:class F sortase [Actinoplanes sp. NBRC 14428]|uniref:Sortase family protein n=1 Tax=Pseudosporangium ferrugineum TaxID=439699 RepID=A0A2T0RTS7_9ACTN|nr:class F sortase [Pseudosporangium ferrugineum]PRY24584.1 sortase family protein [Pseudosporangium ferrugineum]BCJ54827.1 class F sortase [Actinoplanes sp. NBRC 14428]
MTARRALLPVAVAVVTGLVVAAGYLMTHEPRATAEPGGPGGSRAGAAPRGGTVAPVASGVLVAPAAAVPSDRPEAEAKTDPFGTARPALDGPPTRLRVAAAGIDTALEKLHLGAGGELVPPEGDDRAGWYADGTAPGDVGPAVLAGHVDSRSGPAVFYRLRELGAGDRIEVTRGGRRITFTVTSTAWYPKKAFPTARVYGPTPDPQLRLITCGGVFDRSLRSYRDNLVVYAVAG